MTDIETLTAFVDWQRERVSAGLSAPIHEFIADRDGALAIRRVQGARDAAIEALAIVHRSGDFIDHQDVVDLIGTIQSELNKEDQ